MRNLRIAVLGFIVGLAFVLGALIAILGRWWR